METYQIQPGERFMSRYHRMGLTCCVAVPVEHVEALRTAVEVLHAAIDGAGLGCSIPERQQRAVAWRAIESSWARLLLPPTEYRDVGSGADINSPATTGTWANLDARLVELGALLYAAQRGERVESLEVERALDTLTAARLELTTMPASAGLAS